MNSEFKKTKLPTGWKWKKLGEVADYINGRAFKPEEWVLDGLPIIRIQNLNNPNADFNYFKGEIDPRYVIENGDLLISWSASLDAFIWNRGFAVLNQHIFKVAENKEVIHRQYLYFAVREAMVEICKQIHGATMKHITKPEFEKISIPLPPLPEQKRIAGILTEQMAATQKAKRACQEKLEAAEKLPASYLNAIFNSDKAKQWPKKKLGEVCASKTGIKNPKDCPDKEFTYIDISSIDNKKKRIVSPNKMIGVNAPSRARRLVHKDDIILSTTRPNLNAVAKVMDELDGQICSTGFCVLRPLNKIIDKDYLFLFCISPYLTEKLTDLVKGALYPAVTDKQVFAQEIPLPPLPNQKRIAGILTEQMAAAAKVKKAIEEELELINKLPASLLQQAFSGNL